MIRGSKVPKDREDFERATILALYSFKVLLKKFVVEFTKSFFIVIVSLSLCMLVLSLRFIYFVFDIVHAHDMSHISDLIQGRLHWVSEFNTDTGLATRGGGGRFDI